MFVEVIKLGCEFRVRLLIF